MASRDHGHDEHARHGAQTLAHRLDRTALQVDPDEGPCLDRSGAERVALPGDLEEAGGFDAAQAGADQSLGHLETASDLAV